VSGALARLAAMHHPVMRVLRGVRMTLRAETAAHAELRHHGEITTFGNALFWTTTQMLTVSSQFPNPLTTGGKILDVLLEIYALVVVTSVAGAFASFFHHRFREQHGAE
jgi:hypothetical protein